MKPTKESLEKREYPSENSKSTLRMLASGFLLSGTEAERIIEEVYGGIFSTHGNGHALACKILWARYYWTKMESDCYQHIKKCVKCHTYANHINIAPSTLHNLTSPWSFSMWSIDVIGPIEPKASNGHRFILVAIDYFTKWVKVASYSAVTRSVVVKFIKRNIICRYGLPAHIIIDNDTNLNKKLMTELCEQFWIHYHNSTPYRPKMNGAIEAANKNIKKIVQKRVVTYKDWHEVLPYALHGYRTSVRTSTGAIHYSLLYGTEVVLLVEVEILSLRVLAEVELEEVEWIQQQLDQLNLIKEKRLKTLMSLPTLSKKDQECLRQENKASRVQRKRHGKSASNYEGPYVVKHAFSGGALILTDVEGRHLKYPVNVDSIKMFFP
ncbi:Gypsy retrotransposon integrase-like protein 1, partial [Mucuna pruriens]